MIPSEIRVHAAAKRNKDPTNRINSVSQQHQHSTSKEPNREKKKQQPYQQLYHHLYHFSPFLATKEAKQQMKIYTSESFSLLISTSLELLVRASASSPSSAITTNSMIITTISRVYLTVKGVIVLVPQPINCYNPSQRQMPSLLLRFSN